MEAGGVRVARVSSQMSGNPVQVGDGCATVTGNELPTPLVSEGLGRRERGWQPEVRIPGWLRSSRLRPCGADFSVKEKDEASPANGFRGKPLDAFIHCFGGV